MMPRRYSVKQNSNYGRLKISPSINSKKELGNMSSGSSFEENTSLGAAIVRTRAKGVKSEKRKSINLNMDEPQLIVTKKNYMSMESDEFEDRGVSGTRKCLAMKMQTNLVNFTIVGLIISYALFTFIFTAIPENATNSNKGVKAAYHTIECLIVSIFVIEVLFSRYAFTSLYF